MSVHGILEKPYGFNSLPGVVFVILAKSTEVLHYEVKSKLYFNENQGDNRIKTGVFIKVCILCMKNYAVLIIDHHPSR